MLSKRCTYGIRAALYLAAQPEGTLVSIRQISDSLNLSYPFLAKILHHLTRQGIVRSSRGPNGGVALARPAEVLTLKECVLALDGPALFEACVLGLPGCGARKPCPLHDRWSVVRGSIDAAFGALTLAEMARQPNTSMDWLDRLSDDALQTTAPVDAGRCR